MTQNTNLPPTKPAGIASFWDLLTAPSKSLEKLIERIQARLTAALAIAFILFNIVDGILTIRQAPGSLQNFVFPILATLIAYAFTRTRFFSLGSFILIVIFCASAYLNILANNLETRIGILFFIPMALVIGSLIVSTRGLALLTVLNIVAIIMLSITGLVLPYNIFSILGMLTSFGTVIALNSYFRTNIALHQLAELQYHNREATDIRANMQRLVEERTIILDRRAAQLESAALVARAAAEIRDMKELLDTVTTQIAERFGFYHVAIFLADDNNIHLNLLAASSRGGQKMLAQGYKLGIGREGIVGFAAYQKRPRIAQNVGSDAVFFNNPELSTTRSEAALPLLAQNRLVGVLDIQSEDENVFTLDDVSSLQTMTDQIALAIENIRLVEQSRSALLNLESINADNISKAWKERLGNRVIGFTYTPFGVKPINQDNFDNKNNSESEQTFELPLNLRGKEIGSISLMRKSKESIWGETEKEMVQQIAAQVALAIENARLLEESQSRAVREQTVNEFSSRFGRSLDIDTLLQSAVREIYRLPQVSQVSLFINPVKDAQKPE
jgi:GAF domain-containing protein